MGFLLLLGTYTISLVSAGDLGTVASPSANSFDFGTVAAPTGDADFGSV